MNTIVIAFLISIASCCALTSAAVEGQCTIAPTALRCEYLVDPEGIDVREPRLSWVLEHRRPDVRGARQTAYRILVSDDPERLARDEGNLWDSGKIASDASSHIVYAGKRLGSRSQVYWKVRAWDEDDRPSPWSEAARWSMGLLNADDWSAKWIGDPTEAPPVFGAHNGYHSRFAPSPETTKWVAIDLGERRTIDGVRLHPARPYDWREDMPGFMFPQRFRIEVADAPDFAGAKTVVDRTTSDVTNPGTEAATYAFPAVEGRYVRLVATHLRMRDAGNYGLAFAEMQVLSEGRNVALEGRTSASDSIEQGAWSIRNLNNDDLTSHPGGGVEPLPAPMLRREFDLDPDAAPITRATLYVTALGLYEVHINGSRVGDHVLAPEWTDYLRRVQYQAFDVTAHVGDGANAIGVQLADGWYAGEIGLTGLSPTGRSRAIYGRLPKLRLQLEIERSDGTRQVVTSDEHWRSTIDGPLRAADIMDGELYDASMEQDGWDRPGFDADGWTAVRIHDGIDVELDAQRNEPIRVTAERQPNAITEPRPGVYVFDMGQNMVGWCRIKVRGEAGTTVTLRHAEILQPNGMLYTTNLGGAAQTDRFILAGRGVETFEPRFTYHGFRYVEVTGLSQRPAIEHLTGCVVHSDPPAAGRFECSSPMLNQLMQNINWTQRNNMHSTPTDCPQRSERMGWMGDILVFADAACFNLDMAAFYTKWLRDVRDAQAPDGRYPDFAPHPYDPSARFSGTAAWGDAGVFVPWSAYRNYGDVRLLAEHFDSARRWVDHIHERNPDLLWKHSRGNDYGDWLNGDTIELENWPRTGGEVPKEILATAFFARSTELVSRMASVLGRDEDAKHYGELAAGIRDAFNAAYVSDEGEIDGDTQAGYALALRFRLLPDRLLDAAMVRLLAGIERYDGHLSTGFQSTLPLMFVLRDLGAIDTAYELLNRRTPPSWGYLIDQGATTIWERWDGYVTGRGLHSSGMNSFDHYAFGAVGEWMYRTIVGIEPDPEVPAYKRFIVRPRPGGGLTWARGHHDSMHGRIACAWQIDDRRRMAMTVTVPANTTAEIHVPTAEPDDVMEGGRRARGADGLVYIGFEDGAVIYRAGSGRYEFSSQLVR
jgi:alpha-L-rhamnosidase